MKQAIGVISKIMFYVLIVVLLVLNASYTMTFTSTLFPNDMIKIWGSLLLFDVGAVAWFLLFLSTAEGAGQRGVSLLMGIIDLLGSLIIAGAEVFGAASSYLSDPTMTAWLSETATYVLFIWLGINIASTWLYHVFAPHQQEAMMVRAMQDDVTAKALKLAGAQVEQMSVGVANQLAPATVLKVLAELGIKTDAIALPASQSVIDGTAREPEPEHVKAAPASNPLAAVFARKQRQPVQQYQYTALNNAPRYGRSTPAAAATTTGGGQDSATIIPGAQIAWEGTGRPPAHVLAEHPGAVIEGIGDTTRVWVRGTTPRQDTVTRSAAAQRKHAEQETQRIKREYAARRSANPALRNPTNRGQ